ncbi:MAG TPA: M13 family metallopeptidase [Acidobacteriaceae bacterium]|nr:M13 family metallopeptidase [Acidobacteriaceae bacterium]
MPKRQRHRIVILALAAASLAACAAPATAQTSAAPAGGNPAQDRLLPGVDQRYMDTGADPCANFFQYACGNFTRLHPIPPDQTTYGVTTMVFDHTQEALHSLLEKAAMESPARSANEQKTGDFYASCMNTDAIHAQGLKPLQPDLERIAALKNKEELTSLLAHFQLINVNAFFGFGEQQDFKDAQKQIAVVDQGGLGLPERGYYLRTDPAAEKTRQEYVQHITNMLKLLGEPEQSATQDAGRIMDLETALAKLSLDVTSRRDPRKVYHPMSVTDLAALTPRIAWDRFFTETGAPPLTDLNVANPDFFKGLNSLLDSADLESVKAYLRWQLVNSTPSYTLPQALDDEHFNFYGRELTGQPVQRARWKRCAQATDMALGEALGQVYVQQEFPAANKAATLQMVHDIESSMDREIDTLQWMSPETKVKAKEKLHLVANKIGYPDRWRDYSKLTIVRGDAIGNARRAIDFENRRELAKIGKPVDRGEWDMTPSTVNAYYSPLMNDINFPAGILQSPLYDPRSPDAENYGHVGAIVGHELTHGFDDQGRQFDGNGNLASWWTADDAKKFGEMTDCEVKEYDNFTVLDDLKLNGKLTLGENTADNGGIRLAYLAFLEDAKRKGVDLSKQEGGYTPVQQFFLAYGQNWCGSLRPERLRLLVQTNPHSPNEFRVNGVVQNMKEFGTAFGCKVGQPMMPVNACHVW